MSEWAQLEADYQAVGSGHQAINRDYCPYEAIRAGINRRAQCQFRGLADGILTFDEIDAECQLEYDTVVADRQGECEIDD